MPADGKSRLMSTDHETFRWMHVVDNNNAPLVHAWSYLVPHACSDLVNSITHVHRTTVCYIITPAPTVYIFSRNRSLNVGVLKAQPLVCCFFPETVFAVGSNSTNGVVTPEVTPASSSEICVRSAWTIEDCGELRKLHCQCVYNTANCPRVLWLTWRIIS